jgi:predicted aspartyl protease
MANEMGIIRFDIELENPAVLGTRRTVPQVLIDTGAELSCFPAQVLEELGVVRRQQRRFRQADGSVFERWTGTVIVHLGGSSAGDEVIFGEPTDLVLFGSRSLEGLNLRIDPVTKRLSDAGPMLLAATS